MSAARKIKDETALTIDQIVGQRLKVKRTILGLSQDALGKLVGLTFQQIQKYESGKNQLSVRRVLEFARVLNTDASYFFEALASAPAGLINKSGKRGGGNVSVLPAMGLAEDEGIGFVYDLASKNDISDREILEHMRVFISIEDAHFRKQITDLAKSWGRKNTGNRP
jgi:transcriptional regulator with XRE-family HTH domain